MNQSQNAVELIVTDRAGHRMVLTLAPGMSIAIIGTDGTGKSTAARLLAEQLRVAGVPCEQHHWYRWYQAAFMTPFAVAINRRRKRSVQIFDRTVFDNVATMLLGAGPQSRTGLAGFLARVLRTITPAFDTALFLVAAPEVIVQRRPEVLLDDAVRATNIYNEIGRALRLVALDQISVAPNS